MNDVKEVQVVTAVAPYQSKRKLTLKQKAIGVAGAVGAMVLSVPAQAGITTEIVKDFQTQMAEAKADNLTMWGIAGGVLIGFAIWRYAKRGINSL